ncbi:MAG TPA: Gfo/Idh/MocA family oxidoreductase [Lacipirellulaceae bacterium]
MTISRRRFLGTSAAATAAVWSASWSKTLFAQDTADIRIAVIGFNGQGRGHIEASHRNIVALCDVDERVLDRTAKEMADKYGRKVEKFTDFRRLLERKDINAVSVATPNHIHAWVTVLAAQAGKDVYVEKPASHNIWEGRQMVAAARQNNRVIQCGTQSRSSPSLKEAVEWVQGGGLGKILYAVGTCYKPRQSIGRVERPLEIPKQIHYDLWCGPAEKRDLYRPKLHYDWHWDWNTGNGDMGNQGIHQMDIARWFLGEPALARGVISIGGRLGYDDAGNTPNTQVVYLDYEKAPLIFETRGLPRSKRDQEHWGDAMDRFRGSGVGVILQCEKGHVLVPNYTSVEAFDRSSRRVKHWTTDHDAMKTHQDNWLAAIASRDPSRLNAEIHEAHLSSSLCHMGGISHQLGKPARMSEILGHVAANDLLSNAVDRMAGHLRANGVDIDSADGVVTFGPWLKLDPSTEKFVDNDAANELRSRSRQRDGYAVPNLEGSAPKTAAAG